MDCMLISYFLFIDVGLKQKYIAFFPTDGTRGDSLGQGEGLINNHGHVHMPF